VGWPAASSPYDGTGLERLSTPHLMAAAENELHELQRTSRRERAAPEVVRIRRAAAITPRPLAERLLEDEEAERLVTRTLTGQL
jgi:hypothetical protein